jgi:hypothetical protein
MSDISFQRIDVLTDGGAQEGRLVFSEGQLVAVLVHVTEQENSGGPKEGCEGWFREAGFGPCGDLATPHPPVFDTLDKARAWIAERIKAGVLPS